MAAEDRGVEAETRSPGLDDRGDISAGEALVRDALPGLVEDADKDRANGDGRRRQPGLSASTGQATSPRGMATLRPKPS
jgi:hypothetical protein